MICNDVLHVQFGIEKLKPLIPAKSNLNQVTLLMFTLDTHIYSYGVCSSFLCSIDEFPCLHVDDL